MIQFKIMGVLGSLMVITGMIVNYDLIAIIGAYCAGYSIGGLKFYEGDRKYK